MTLEKEFYNKLAYAAVKAPRRLKCGITIRPLITGGLIAGRNGILVESLLQVTNVSVSTTPL